MRVSQPESQQQQAVRTQGWVMHWAQISDTLRLEENRISSVEPAVWRPLVGLQSLFLNHNPL